MIYLFNSGFRPQYVSNVLRTIYFPQGWINEYRYSLLTNRSNVDSALINHLDRRSFWHKIFKEDILITYVNRFGSNGYEYIPLRKGKFLLYEQSGEKYFFRVVLDDFLFPKDFNAFQKTIVETLPNLPKLTENNRENPNDGAYAIFNDINICSNDDFIGSVAWGKIVESLSSTPIFGSNPDTETVFLRVEVPEAKVVLRKHSLPYIQVKKDQEYLINYFYQYPKQKGDKSIKVEFTEGNNLQIIGNKKLSIDNINSRGEIRLKAKKYPTESHDSISMEFDSEIKEKKILTVDRGLDFEIGEIKFFWIQVIVLIFIFSLAGSIKTQNLDLDGKLTSDISSVINFSDFIKYLGQAFAVLFLIRLFGKKPI